MEISDPGKTPLSQFRAAQGATPAAGGQPRDGARQPAAADHIQLSNLSAYLAAAQSDSTAHLAKLSSLAGAVSSGGYQVEPGLVSASLIQHSLGLGGAGYAP